MIIMIDLAILMALIMLELVIIKQFWMINMEVQKVKFSRIEAVNERYAIRSDIKTLDYTADQLESDDIDKHIFK
ncbi:MAG TPA: hypothetical protein PKK26_17870 [Candidatus Wallbacteria bacterium]|nr:hypothetical protein [Candidatus Wallbacteria bacterium]